MNVNNKIAAILDTETTKIGGEVIELAYIEVTLEDVGKELTEESCCELKHVHKYFSPKEEIAPAAMAVHHIIPDDLVNKPSSETAITYLPDCTYIIGHNIDYDWRVLGEFDCKRIDTLAICRALYPDLSSHTLSALIYTFLDNKEMARHILKNAHSAIVDVQINLILLNTLCKNVPVFNTYTSFEELYLFSEECRLPKVMPFGKHKGSPLNKVPLPYFLWLLNQPEVDPYLVTAINRVIHKNKHNTQQ